MNCLRTELNKKATPHQKLLTIAKQIENLSPESKKFTTVIKA